MKLFGHFEFSSKMTFLEIIGSSNYVIEKFSRGDDQEDDRGMIEGMINSWNRVINICCIRAVTDKADMLVLSSFPIHNRSFWVYTIVERIHGVTTDKISTEKKQTRTRDTLRAFVDFGQGFGDFLRSDTNTDSGLKLWQWPGFKRHPVYRSMHPLFRREFRSE